MKKFRIGYFADGPWSHKAFEKIQSRNDCYEIVFIVPRIVTDDKVLESYAKEHDIPLLKGHNINTPEFIQLSSSFKCDLFVSMSFNQIFRKSTIEIPKLGTINCHAGMLPFYRGRNVLNWAIINGEKEIGVTVHYIDEGIDTGDIILQNKFPIMPEDDYGSVLEKAYIECANTLMQSLELFYNESVESIPQNEISAHGFYCGGRIEGDEFIDWNQSSLDIFNLIRGLNGPNLSAKTTYLGEHVSIYKCKFNNDWPNYKGIPGQVLIANSEGLLVKTSDNVIHITSYKSKTKISSSARFK